MSKCSQQMNITSSHLPSPPPGFKRNLCGISVKPMSSTQSTMNTPSEKNLLSSTTLATLVTMTRDELRRLAKRIGIKRGRNRTDTIINLHLAHTVGVMHTKIKVEFCPKPEKPEDYRVPIFGKKFSNGKTAKVFRTIL